MAGSRKKRSKASSKKKDSVRVVFEGDIPTCSGHSFGKAGCKRPAVAVCEHNSYYCRECLSDARMIGMTCPTTEIKVINLRGTGDISTKLANNAAWEAAGVPAHVLRDFTLLGEGMGCNNAAAFYLATCAARKLRNVVAILGGTIKWRKPRKRIAEDIEVLRTYLKQVESEIPDE